MFIGVTLLAGHCLTSGDFIIIAIAELSPLGLHFACLPETDCTYSLVIACLQVVAARNYAVEKFLPVKDFLDHASYDCGTL